MLERLIIRNFKLFDEVEIELGEAVVLIGPNNAGKTSALQALALWDLGVKRWSEKRGAKPTAKKRSGVTINRRDLLSLPVPETNLLWRDLHVRKVNRASGKQKTHNIRVDIEVHGVTSGKRWTCGLEFDYANAESLYCRPLGWARGDVANEDPIPPEALDLRVAYLPPMSGLAANETRLDSGAVQVRLGEGRTAEVLRNLCYALVEDADGDALWDELSSQIRALFGVHLRRPEYIPERGELTMSFDDVRGVRLDISSAGRGMQQTILLMAFLMANPGSVLLLDEPDAHLEVLRQRQIYNSLTDAASASGSQIIAASHSEVILGEAAGRDVVIAFVGKPHRINGRGSQAIKALKTIGFDDYYLAESTGWVLYLEGSTDLEILRAFAKTLGHAAARVLERPFVHYIANQVNKARDHFYGVREAKQNLVGFVLTDRLDQPPKSADDLRVQQWRRREIENYFCLPSVLERYAANLVRERSEGPLFESVQMNHFIKVMRERVARRVPPAAMENGDDRWWKDVKASDDFLDPVFEEFFEKVDLPNLMRKTHFHRLAALVDAEQIDDEVSEVLDEIYAVATRRRPPGETPEEEPAPEDGAPDGGPGGGDGV